jgi:hypothetical protein
MPAFHYLDLLRHYADARLSLAFVDEAIGSEVVVEAIVFAHGDQEQIATSGVAKIARRRGTLIGGKGTRQHGVWGISRRSDQCFRCV